MPVMPESKRLSLMQSCRDFIRMLSYEDILSCTVYVPPMLFMVGPASIAARSPLINLVLNAFVGFGLSWALHRMGHRLLMALPDEPQLIFFSPCRRLPVKLSLTQFVWMMEMIVATAVFSGVMGKRLLLGGGPVELITSMICFSVAVGLFFLPVYLAKLWIARYYPAMPLSSPTDEAVSQSLSVILSIANDRTRPRS
jgi:hypothetical protein